MSAVLHVIHFGEKYSDSGDNAWAWKWLDDKVQHDERDTETVRDAFRKVSQDSTARCITCGRDINYGSRGVVALKDHMQMAKHCKQRRALKKNTTVPGTNV